MERARVGFRGHLDDDGSFLIVVPPAANFAAPRLLHLASKQHRQIVVGREPGQYLGHPTTMLLEDHETMIAAYPKGHGVGPS